MMINYAVRCYYSSPGRIFDLLERGEEKRGFRTMREAGMDGEWMQLGHFFAQVGIYLGNIQCPPTTQGLKVYG